MNTLYNCYKSEFLKMKRTSLLIIHIFSPISFMLLLLIYILLHQNLANPYKLFNFFYQLLAIGYVFIIPLVSGISGEMEEANNYQILFCQFQKKITSFVGKLAMLISIGFISYFMTIIFFNITIDFFYPNYNNMTWINLFITSFSMFLSGLFLYVFSLVLVYKFNFGLCVVLSVFGTILAAISITGLGDKIWLFLPPAWPIRIGVNFNEITINQLNFIIISTIAIVLISCTWYDLWEPTRR